MDVADDGTVLLAGPEQLLAVDPADGSRRVLVDERVVSMSPRGTTVAFVEWSSQDVFTAPLSGGTPEPVLYNGFAADSVRWAGDTLLAAVTAQASGGGLSVGDELQDLTRGGVTLYQTEVRDDPRDGPRELSITGVDADEVGPTGVAAVPAARSAAMGLHQRGVVLTEN